ncbi:MAG TPA: hypothetical protein VM536_11300 [Chloroflexia bacterium]|nr:hypothetical protein [Chloroflexia bacterium]
MLLALFAAPWGAIYAADAPLTGNIHALNSSGVEGTLAISAPAEGQTLVLITLAGSPTGALDAQIHRGVCSGMDGETLYTLLPVVNGRSQTTLNIPIGDITQGTYYVVRIGPVGGVAVACGDIPVSKVAAGGGSSTGPGVGGTTNPNPCQGGTANPYPGGTNNPYPGGTNNPYPGGTNNPYPGGTNNPYPGGTNNPYPGGTTNPYPCQGGTTSPYPTAAAPTPAPTATPGFTGVVAPLAPTPTPQAGQQGEVGALPGMPVTGNGGGKPALVLLLAAGALLLLGGRRLTRRA